MSYDPEPEEVRHCHICGCERNGYYSEFVDAQDGVGFAPSWPAYARWHCLTCRTTVRVLLLDT